VILPLLLALAQVAALDEFEDAAAWKAAASDGVTSSVANVPGATGQAMRLSYDFGAVSGYAFARRTLPIEFPANYRMRLKLRGTGGVNDVQLKFTNASGDTVWWVQLRNFRPQAEWQDITFRPRDIAFAWGPGTDKTLRKTEAVEIVVVRGRDGGAGTLEIDDWSFEPLPPAAPLPPPRASDPRAIDGRGDTAWTGRGGDALSLDFGGARLIGGVTLRWANGAGAPAYAAQVSDDGRSWRSVRAVSAGDGGDDPILLTDTEARYLRVALPPGAARARLAEVTVHPAEWGATPNAFISALAKAAPRGTYPRGFTEQSYWTLVATDSGEASALIGEDGAIEVAKGGFSIEPFVVADDRRIGWADARAAQSLEDRYLPIPHVALMGQGWRLDTMLFADRVSRRPMARWRLTNTGAAPRALTLLLAVRPFQVNGPAQFLSQQGGVSPISGVRWTGQDLAVTTPPAIAGDPAITRTLRPIVPPTAIGTAPFDQGALAVPVSPNGTTSLSDPTGLGSATMAWKATLAPGETLDVPLALADGPALTRSSFDAAHAATAAWWRDRLGGVTLRVPPAKQAVADTIRTATAHVLMSRDGPMLKPGTRSYDRSWIRDGAMMSDTLLRLGLPGPGRAFADWYGPKLFANGKVPCCVDARGPDPVPENDSHGQYIHLVTELYRFTGDRAALERDWPRINAARRYMEGLRQSERTPANQTPDRRMLYGLMPPSISHEGYSAKAQYSLWDDFWALTGYKDAAYAAQVLNKPETAEIGRQLDQFAGDVHAAIQAAAKHWKIDFIPGATSLGDFDATSTTMALDPAGEQAALDPKLLANTFERQWQRVMGRPGSDEWEDYTPYELRNVSALVRLGWRERANDLLDFYMADRRPAAWNDWAEVVGREPRETRFIGDMPHAWVASDFIRAALDLFAYVRAEDEVVVLGGGLTEAWLQGSGTTIKGLKTRYGTIDLSMRADAGGLTLDLAGDASPPGGFVVPWPLKERAGRATVDGRSVPVVDGAVRLKPSGRPMQVRLERQQTRSSLVP
jgi:hypothetical protein